MEVNSQLHAPAALFPRKESLMLIEQKAGWAPEPVWKLKIRENVLPLPGKEPRTSSP
jgi:hypothetical protein